MLISVIVPVYNVEKYIEACLESIIESDLDCEVIMIDDGSIDSSPNICKNYTKKYNNFSFFVNQGKGPSDARNMGMDKAKGEYIWFVDSDDLICGDFKTIQLMATIKKSDVIAFDAIAFNETKDEWNLNHYDRRKRLGDIDVISGKEFFKKYYLLDAYRDSVCLNLYKKEFLYQNKIQFASGLLYEDTEFNFHVYMTAETIKYIPQIYYKRRYRYGSTMTTEINEKKIKDFFKILETNTIKMNHADTNLNHMFARYLFDMYVVQLERIEQSDISEKEKYFIEAFETFFQTFQRLISDKINLPNINMILTYMNKLEGMTDKHVLEQKKYEWQGNLYNWEELKQKFQRQHKLLISEVLKNLPLDKNVSIGIYGIGKHTERMLEEYQKYVGKIKANLIFFDSNIQSYTVLYKEKNVLNIKDISNKDLKTIIISSFRYQDILYHTVSKINRNINVIKLYTKEEDTFDYFL